MATLLAGRRFNADVACVDLGQWEVDVLAKACGRYSGPITKDVPDFEFFFFIYTK